MRPPIETDALVSEALLDQHLFCGVGNVYRSEVLWATQVSPFAKIGVLEPAAMANMDLALRGWLELG